MKKQKYNDYGRKEPLYKNCKRKQILCNYCNILFWEKSSSSKKNKKHFCSMKCYALYRKEIMPKEEQPNYKNGGMSLEEKNKRIKVRSILNHAIRDKKIIKQNCESCGCEESQGHHIDYDKPLEVKWLCRKCHQQEHKIIYKNPELLKGEKI
jgi:hypothetical protein